jgi:hypothetical protein
VGDGGAAMLRPSFLRKKDIMKTYIIKLALYFANYTDLELSNFGALSISCLTNNPLTPDLPVKVPALTTLQAAFADSIQAAQQGGKVETAKKNQGACGIAVGIAPERSLCAKPGLDQRRGHPFHRL